MRGTQSSPESSGGKRSLFPARFFSRKVVATLGCLGGVGLLAAALFLIRYPKWAISLRSAHATLAKILLFQPRTPILATLPPTFIFSLALALVGGLLLTLALEPRTHSTQSSGDEANDSRRRSFRFIEAGVLLVIAAVAVGLFAVAEWKGFLKFFWMVIPWSVLLLGAVTLLVIWDRRSKSPLKVVLSKTEWIGLGLAAVVAMGIYASGFRSWKYAFIGDEYAFYWKAEQIAGKGLLQLNWFEANGVYGGNPLALSGWQALWMKVFGVNNFGWLFSVAALTVICLPPLYLLLRRLLSGACAAPKISAAVGCAIFFLSEQILVWTRIGKPHSASLCTPVFALCFLLAARRRQSRLYYFLTGAACGAGLHILILGSVIAVPIVAGVLLADWAVALVKNPRAAFKALLPIVIVLMGFVLIGAPILVQLDHFEHHFQKQLMAKEDPRTLEGKIRKTIQALAQFLHFQAGNHFLWRNVVDPLTAFFVLAALGMGRRLGWRTLALLLWIHFITAFATGGIGQYAYPALTRTLLLMIPVAMLAAAGFSGLFGRWKRVAWIAAPLVVLGVGAYNILKLQEYNPYQRPANEQMLIAKRIEESEPNSYHMVFFPKGEDPYLARTILKNHGHEQRVELLNMDEEGIRRLSERLDAEAANTRVAVRVDCKDVGQIKNLTRRKGGVWERPLQRHVIPRPRPERVEGILGFLYTK